MDARFEIRKEADVRSFLDRYKKNDISCFYYPYGRSDCAYEEAYTCLDNPIQDKHLICEQICRYKADGFPEQNGLYATGIMIRRNNKDVKRFNETWWNELRDYSERIRYHRHMHRGNLKFLLRRLSQIETYTTTR